REHTRTENPRVGITKWRESNRSRSQFDAATHQGVTETVSSCCAIGRITTIQLIRRALIRSSKCPVPENRVSNSLFWVSNPSIQTLNSRLPRCKVTVMASAQKQIPNDWDVFISHASEDKKTIVEPLAAALSDLGVKVWYDNFLLRGGDSLTQ